jgi:preprotein translocase subunit Sec61beta
MKFIVGILKFIRTIFGCMVFMGLGIIARGIFSSDPSDGNQITPAIVVGLVALVIALLLNQAINKLAPTPPVETTKVA